MNPIESAPLADKTRYGLIADVDARRIPLPKTGHEPPPRGGVILAAVGEAAIAESVLLEANSESDDVGWLLGEDKPA